MTETTRVSEKKIVKINYISTLFGPDVQTEQGISSGYTGGGGNKGSVFVVSYSEIFNNTAHGKYQLQTSLPTPDNNSGKCALLFTSKDDFDRWNDQYEILVNGINKSEFLDYVPWLEDYTNSDGSISGKIEIISKRLVREFISNNFVELAKSMIPEQDFRDLSDESKREILKDFRKSFDFIGMRVFKKQITNIVSLSNTISLGKVIKGWHKERYCKKVVELIEDLCISTLYLLSILQMSNYNISSFTPQSAFLQNVGNLKDVPVRSPNGSNSLTSIIKIIKEKISTKESPDNTSDENNDDYGEDDDKAKFTRSTQRRSTQIQDTFSIKNVNRLPKSNPNINETTDCDNIWEHHSIGPNVLFSVKKTSRLLVIPNGFSKPDKNKEIDFKFFRHSIESIPYVAPETLLFQLYDQKSECFCAHMMILGSAYSVHPFMDDGDKFPDDYWWNRFVPPASYTDEFTRVVKDVKISTERNGLPLPFMCYDEMVSNNTYGEVVNLVERVSLYLFNLALFIGPLEFEKHISEELFRLEPLVEIENCQRDENYVRGISKDLGVKLIGIIEKYTGKNTSKMFFRDREFTKFIPKSCGDLFKLSLKCNPHERMNPIGMIYSMTEKLKHRYTPIPHIEMKDLPLSNIKLLGHPELGVSTGGFKIVGNELQTQSGNLTHKANQEFLSVIESIISYTGTNEYYYRSLVDEANVEIVTRRILGTVASEKLDFGILKELRSYAVKSSKGISTTVTEQLEAMKNAAPKQFFDHPIFKSLEYHPSVISEDTLKSAASVKKLSLIRDDTL